MIGFLSLISVAIRCANYLSPLPLLILSLNQKGRLYLMPLLSVSARFILFQLDDRCILSL